MPKHTDSATIEHHEDGSRTITTVETIYPATKKQQAAAWGAVGIIGLAPILPLLCLVGYEKWEERKERKRAAKLKPVN